MRRAVFARRAAYQVRLSGFRLRHPAHRVEGLQGAALRDANRWDAVEIGPEAPSQVAAVLLGEVVPEPLPGACLAARQALDGSEVAGQDAMAVSVRLWGHSLNARAQSRAAAVRCCPDAERADRPVASFRRARRLRDVVASEPMVALALLVACPQDEQVSERLAAARMRPVVLLLEPEVVPGGRASRWGAEARL